MFAPLPQERAEGFLRNLIRFLDEEKIVLNRISTPSVERENSGVMVGAVCCHRLNGDETAEVFAYTVSGSAYVIEDAANVAGGFFVEPIVSPFLIAGALEPNDREIHQLTDSINDGKKSGIDVTELVKKREKLTTASLKAVHDLYSFTCWDGMKRSLGSICHKKIPGKLPPTGTGECCAPKLLDWCYRNGLRPVSMCEMYYGNSSAERKSGTVYSPCDSRCGLLLPEMMGLEILYRDDSICVVNKQSGLLSVPGRGQEKFDSVETRFLQMFGSRVEPVKPSVHRLDMETSGIMILAFTREAHRKMNMAFEQGLCHKEYIAVLDGILPAMGIEKTGTMELYFRLDVDNRPHQIWDEVYGKKAVTEWEILGVEKYAMPDGGCRNGTRVRFIPHTGRTHQLRLASADSHGFGVPIVGDTLYGHCQEGQRLLLHAKKITFPHPMTGEKVTIECKEPF